MTPSKLATPPPITPFWPLSSLLRSLARAGWGDLRDRTWQGVRATLLGLGHLLPDKSAQGDLTIWQLSEVIGRSTKWTARCMNVLEELGVVRWQRGGAVDGRPRPSAVRVDKRRIVELILAARPEHEQRSAEQAARVREKIAHLKYAFGWQRGSHLDEARRRRRGIAPGQPQVEVTATLRSPTEESPTPSGRGHSTAKQHLGAPSGALTVDASANSHPAGPAQSPPGGAAPLPGESTAAWLARHARWRAEQSAGEE